MQERRRGSESNLSGSRLSGTRSRSLNGPPIAHDDAGRNDEYRPGHCDSCKVPEATEHLLTFELRLGGRPAGAWTLCQKCWQWRNERAVNADPLQLVEAS